MTGMIKGNPLAQHMAVLNWVQLILSTPVVLCPRVLEPIAMVPAVPRRRDSGVAG